MSASFNSGSIGAANGVSTVSGTLTVNSNSNRVLVALIGSDGGDATVSSVGYTSGSGGTWTKLNHSRPLNGRSLELWWSIAPSSGSVTVSTTLATPTGGIVIGLMDFYDADQTTVMNNGANNDGTAGTINVSTTSGDIAVSMWIDALGSGTITVGTQQFTAGPNQIFDGATNTGSGSTTFTWTGGIGRCMIGGNVIQAAAGTTNIMGQIWM